MKKKITLLVIVAFTLTVNAQYPVGDKWYQNPLGFKPVQLHTSMGFIIPALVVAGGVLLTAQDSTLTNRLSVYTEGGVTFGYKYPYTTVLQNNTGINLMLRKWMSVGAEFSLTAPSDNFNKGTLGFSIRPFARFYMVNKPSWKIWFESGGGIIYFLDNFPEPTPRDGRTGTYWNGTTKYGLGLQIAVSNNTSVFFGARHLHISNGDTRGADRNPSHDSNGLFMGINWNIDSRK